MARPEPQRADGNRLRLLQKHEEHPSASALLEQYHGHTGRGAQTAEETENRRSFSQQTEIATRQYVFRRQYRKFGFVSQSVHEATDKDHVHLSCGQFIHVGSVLEHLVGHSHDRRDI